MTFLDRVLSLATYLLYGMNHDGFYPSKAMAGESKLTAQLRCACLHVWKAAFPPFFRANAIHDTLQVLTALEGEFLSKNRYSFWINALINRVCRYATGHLLLLLRFDAKDVLQRRKGTDSASPTPTEEAKQSFLFARKGRDGRAHLVGVDRGCEWKLQKVFLDLLDLLEASADRVFAENSFETDREKEVRFSAAAQLGVRCDEVAAEAAREA